jgi:hypothetical protein
MITPCVAAGKTTEMFYENMKILLKSDFLNVVIQEEVYVSQPQVLRTPSILIECTSFQKLCTGLSKHREHDMLSLKLFC